MKKIWRPYVKHDLQRPRRTLSEKKTNVLPLIEGSYILLYQGNQPLGWAIKDSMKGKQNNFSGFPKSDGVLLV